jgi:hypothetical protein
MIMQDQVNAIPSPHRRSIRTKLQIEGQSRDLAMFNLAIDSKLRGCDVVAIKVEDIARADTRGACNGATEEDGTASQI